MTTSQIHIIMHTFATVVLVGGHEKTEISYMYQFYAHTLDKSVHLFSKVVLLQKMC